MKCFWHRRQKKKHQFKFSSNLSKIFSNRKGRLCHWFCQIWVDDHPQAQAQSQANPASNARLSDCVPKNCLQFILETVGMFRVGALLGCIQHQPEFLENSTCKLNSWCDILFMNKCLQPWHWIVLITYKCTLLVAIWCIDFQVALGLHTLCQQLLEVCSRLGYIYAEYQSAPRKIISSLKNI